jgi:hypothetical protein
VKDNNKVTFTELCRRGLRRWNGASKVEWVAFAMLAAAGIWPWSKLRGEITALLRKRGAKTLTDLRKQHGVAPEFSQMFQKPHERQLINQGFIYTSKAALLVGATLMMAVLVGCGGGGGYYGGGGGYYGNTGDIIGSTWRDTYVPMMQNYQQQMNQIYGPGTMGNPIHVQVVPRYW